MERKEKAIRIGTTWIGQGYPIAVQSMTNTDTRDIAATVRQVKALEDAGCDIVRLSVYDDECALALKQIKKQSKAPLVADIHFDYRLAISAMENGADKIRFNPGNIGSEQNLKKLVSAAKNHGVPIRIGVNGGSLEPELLKKYTRPTPEAMVESAMRHVRLLEKENFEDIVISIKSSSVPDTVQAYRLLAEQTDYALHIGITEAGGGHAALLKAAVGLGTLLMEDIGSTLRVSLTGDPVQEVYAGIDILKAAGLRKQGIEWISCPTCGRCRTNLPEIASQLKETFKDEKKYLKVAVMGCAVNGPGEAREADIGIAFGQGNGVIFKGGEKIAFGNLPQIVDQFRAEIANMLSQETMEG